MSEPVKHRRCIRSVEELSSVINEFIHTDSLWFEVMPVGDDEYYVYVKLDRKDALDYAIQRAREG